MRTKLYSKIANFRLKCMNTNDGCEFTPAELMQWLRDNELVEKYEAAQGNANLWRKNPNEPWSINNIEWRDALRPKKAIPHGSQRVPRIKPEKRKRSVKPMSEQRQSQIVEHFNQQPENQDRRMLTLTQWISELKAG